VQTVEIMKTEHHFYHVMEFCNGGSLDELLAVRTRLTEPEVWSIMRQVIQGCRDIASHNYLHRDIKAENVVLHFPEFGQNIIKATQRQ
jgi:serine/threonine protein kinase